MILELDRYLIIPAILIAWFVIPILLAFVITPFKLVEKSSKKLEFSLRPIFRLVFASIAGGITAFFVLIILFHNYYTSLNCWKIQADSNDSQVIKCNIVAKSLVFNIQNQSFYNLLKAKLEPREKKKEDDEQLANIILVTSQAEIDLSSILLSNSRINQVNKTVININEFINNSVRELKIEKDESMFVAPVMYLAAFFLIVTLLLFILPGYRYYCFDSESKEFTMTKKSYFRENILYQIPLEDITKVKVETRMGEETMVQEIILNLKAGKKISLTGIADSYGYQSSLAKSIRNFLKAQKQKEPEQ